MKNSIFLFPFIVLVISSCIDKQNFGQYRDLDIVPTLEASILYIESPERLLNEATGIDFYSREINFDAFAANAFSSRVIEGFIFFEIENTTSKALEVTVEFLDEAGNMLDAQVFYVDAAPTPLLERQVAYGDGSARSIEIIKNTSSIQVSVLNLGGNTSVSSFPDPKFVFKSSGKFKVRLK